MPPPTPQQPALRGVGRHMAFAAAAVVAVLGSTPTATFAQTAPLTVEASESDEGGALFSYSSDGVQYSPAVPELFGSSPKLVPGESLAEDLWVRNENSLTVDVSVAGLAPAGVGEDARVGLTPSPAVTLQPGEAAPLPLLLWLPESAGNESQDRTWAVRLRVHAREVVAGSGGELGNTGGATGIWPLAVASFLVGSGAYLASRRRSKDAKIEGETPQ